VSRVVWITGLPASGKTTLGRRVVDALRARGERATLLDSDEARRAITPAPTYAPDERLLFYRALAFTAASLARNSIVPVVAATAHDAALRDAIRAIVDEPLLVFARCPLEICERRDPKGLYRTARAHGEGNFPGVHVAFVEPHDADFVIDTSAVVTQAEIDRLVDAIAPRAVSNATHA
jgi:adenylylsulfate kinase